MAENSKYSIFKAKKHLEVRLSYTTKRPENHEGLDHITKRRKGNKVVYADTYEEFQKDLMKNPSSVRKEFLKWLETT